MRPSTTGPLQDLALAFAVLLTRLPFLGPGAGNDNDGWFLVNAAREIAATGRYTTSRFPGYPVQEWLASLVVRAGGGVWLIDLLSASACAACVFVFARLLRRIGAPDAAWLAAALAFVPAVAIASVSAMDYLFALAFVLAAAHARVTGRVVLMGLWLGLAIGTRLTSVVLVPALVLLPIPEAQAHGETRRLSAALALAALIAAACYVPAYQRYGAGFLQFVDPLHTGSTPLDFLTGFLHLDRSPFPPALVIGQATALLWGVPGTIALFVAFVLRRSRRSDERAPLASPRVLHACLAAIACELVLYLRLPHDEGYLIPLVPFVLIVLARRATTTARRVVIAALLLSPFVLGVDAIPPKKGVTPLERSPWCVQRGASGRAAVLDVLRGPWLQDHDKRVRAARICTATLATRAGDGPRTFVVAGVLSAELVARGGLDRAHPWLTDLIGEPALRDSLAAGADVLVLPGARERHLIMMGYDPVAAGARAGADPR